MTEERWKPVVAYEGKYEVSNLGHVRSLDRLDSLGRRRKGKNVPQRNIRDHYSVALCANGIRKQKLVHRLVLEAFVGPCPEGMEGCHWNDVGTDNRLENLRWDTRAANISDSVRNGTHHMASRTSCPKGHPYTPENTYIYPGGNRACQECRRIYRQEHAAERRLKGREYMRARRAAKNKENSRGHL